MSIIIKITSESDEVFVAKILIERLQKKNNLKFNLEICFDWMLIEECGVYYPVTHPNKIFINPTNCMPPDKGNFDKDNLFYIGYTKDLSLCGILIHEFCHFLTHRVFPSLKKDYKEKFPTTRLYLNTYSDHELDDEIAEIGTLFITNPGLLKLISKDHWKFFTQYFKSPVASSTKQMFTIYSGYPIEVKQELESKWKIVYDVHQEKFIKKE